MSSINQEKSPVIYLWRDGARRLHVETRRLVGVKMVEYRRVDPEQVPSAPPAPVKPAKKVITVATRPKRVIAVKKPARKAVKP